MALCYRWPNLSALPCTYVGQSLATVMMTVMMTPMVKLWSRRHGIERILLRAYRSGSAAARCRPQASSRSTQVMRRICQHLLGLHSCSMHLPGIPLICIAARCILKLSRGKRISSRWQGNLGLPSSHRLSCCRRHAVKSIGKKMATSSFGTKKRLFVSRFEPAVV
jgi:hypothetical protein